jgi:hypothetical protein
MYLRHSRQRRTHFGVRSDVGPDVEDNARCRRRDGGNDKTLSVRLDIPIELVIVCPQKFSARRGNPLEHRISPVTSDFRTQVQSASPYAAGRMSLGLLTLQKSRCREPFYMASAWRARSFGAQDLLENAELDAKQRQLIWPDAERLDLGNYSRLCGVVTRV